MCVNGDMYEGRWHLDERHGHGKAAFASGLRYEGDWRNDKVHG